VKLFVSTIEPLSDGRGYDVDGSELKKYFNSPLIREFLFFFDLFSEEPPSPHFSQRTSRKAGKCYECGVTASKSPQTY
jgi:hypothetical protein